MEKIGRKISVQFGSGGFESQSHQWNDKYVMTIHSNNNSNNYKISLLEFPF